MEDATFSFGTMNLEVAPTYVGNLWAQAMFCTNPLFSPVGRFHYHFPVQVYC